MRLGRGVLDAPVKPGHDSSFWSTAYRHFGDSVGTFGQGQFFQLPSASTQTDGPGLFVGAGVLAVFDAAKRWST